MSCCRSLLAALVVLAFVPTAPASQLLFGKKAKVNPHQRVPELLVAVQQEADEDKRAAAAEELRQFSTQDFPNIVPILVDVLKKDLSATVRLDTASTLAKIRPTTKAARDALENAANNDSHWRVRLNARSSLMFYHVPNDTAKKNDPANPSSITPTTNEPPLFDPNAAPPRPSTPIPALPVSNPGRVQPGSSPASLGPPEITPPPLQGPRLGPPQ